MKKVFLRLVLIVLSALLLAPLSAQAALTEAQQQAVISFTEDFLTRGNEKHLLQYGNVENFRTIQGQLVHCTSMYKEGTHSKTLWMIRPGGYKNAADYANNVNYFKEGDYLTISCVGFADMMLKNTLGIRLEYVYPNLTHASNWESYMFADNPLVNTYDGTGRTSLFEIVFDKTTKAKQPMMVIDSSILQPGDLIVGRCDAENYGHVMLCGGGDVVYQASMTPLVNPDGTYYGSFVRKDSLNNCKTRSYTRLTVYRLSDGVLDPSFPGYTDLFDFDNLSTDSSVFDTDRPRVEKITFASTAANGRYRFTVDASDEFGDEVGKIGLISDPTILLRGNGNHQSGILGYYLSTDPTAPADPYSDGWTVEINNRYQIVEEVGTYYLWLKDRAGNISDRWRIDITKEKRTAKLDSEASRTPQIVGAQIAALFVRNVAF